MSAAPKLSDHAPSTSWATRWLGRFYVTGSFWYRFHRFGVTFLPSSLVIVIAIVFTSFFFVTLRSIRAAVAANWEAVAGPCGWIERQHRIWQTFWSFAWCLSERYEKLCTDRKFEVEVEGLEHWQAHSSRGLIAVTAHFGSWEVGSMLPRELEARRVHVVREPERDADAQEFINELLTAAGDDRYVTHFATDDPALGIELLDALRHGEIVALQADRPRGGGQAIQVEFFSRPFPLPAGVFALARVSEAPLIPVFVKRLGRRHYRVIIRPVIAIDQRLPRKDGLQQAADRVAAEVQRVITQTPSQWFCFQRVWR